MSDVLFWLILLAGAGQLVLCLASPFIPVALGWPAQVRCLPKLLRQVFWTYAAYILASHVVFAAVSLLAGRQLLDGSGWALGVSSFIAFWWGVRLILHFVAFDASEVSASGWHRIAEHLLGLLFLALTGVYLVVALFNLGVFP